MVTATAGVALSNFSTPPQKETFWRMHGSWALVLNKFPDHFPGPVERYIFSSQLQMLQFQQNHAPVEWQYRRVLPRSAINSRAAKSSVTMSLLRGGLS